MWKELIVCVFLFAFIRVRSQVCTRSNIAKCDDDCKNGQWSPKNECICFESYEIYPPGSNTCVDKCPLGYKRVDGVCRPHCSESCAPRTCIEPERCSCDNGWTVNDQGHCVSMCNPKCGNGTCVDWNKCDCWAGYSWNKSKDPQCEPLCRNCHGFCVAPGKCQCREPYTPRQMTMDGRKCSCTDDCETKCFKTIFVLRNSPSTDKPEPNKRNQYKSTGPGQRNSGVKLKVRVEHKSTSKIKSENHRNKKVSQTENTWKTTCLYVYSAFTIISSVVLSVFIVREFCK